MRLYEVTQLLEYNKGATLNKWGERIAQAAKFNRQHLGDSWFITLLPSSTSNYDPDGPEADEFIAEMVLEELEKMDPTPNKQYVMTLVRWYIGNVKKHNQLQAQYDDWRRDANLDRYGEAEYPDSGYPEDYYDLDSIADEFDDFEDDFGNYVMNPENLDTFKIEDADQIKTALERYHSMKPQLQPNERDIGRFKTFYRFEDFVDSKMDPELKAEIENEILNRSDVKVLYNGPLGTVTVPKSHEASCELGRGTKWCTATTNSDTWFNAYNRSNDLIIYNEKPGNAKYQFHVKLNDIEARDARDRSLPYAQLSNFLNKHPVMSKILKDSKIKAVEKLAHMSFSQSPDGAMGMNAGAEDKVFEILLQYNEKRGGGVMKFLDGFYTNKQSTFGLANAKQLPVQKYAKRLVRYALQRKKPWPQMERLIVALLQKTLPKVDYSNNTHLKRLENFTKIMDSYADVLNPQWKEYSDIKAEMVAGIGAVQDKSQPVQEMGSQYGAEGKPEWYDRAVQLKLDNPRITAAEIAKQVGITNSKAVSYWLTGKDQFRPMMARPKGSFPFEPGDFPLGAGSKKFYDGEKPEWYDQALQMAKAGESFTSIAKKFGTSIVTVGNWLVKGRKSNGKIVNPDAELEPRVIRGQKVDINLINSFIRDWNLTDKEIIELVADEKGPKIAGQVRDMLPALRKKLNPGTQVIDKTRSMRNPDITGLVR